MKLVPLKFLARVTYGLGQPPREADDGVPVIRATNIYRGKIIRGGLMRADPAHVPWERCPPLAAGEILVVRSGAYTGDSALVTDEWLGAAPGYDLRITPVRVDPRYLAYVLLSTTTIDYFCDCRSRAAQPHLNADQLANLGVPALDPIDQQPIADFLDAETTRIDALMAAKHKQRELARERYASWRRGLFSSVAAVRPLGLTARVLRGTTFPDRYQGDRAGDLPFVKVGDFSREGNTTVVRGADNWITFDVARELRATVIPRDGVLFPRVGMAMMSNPRRIAGLDLVMDDNQLALVLTERGEPRYLFHWMLDVDLVAESNPGTVPSVTDASLKRLRIPWPSRHEQGRIADALDREAMRVFDLDHAFERSITLLRERRQALITAAVTGKLDVG